ncbi:MAG TPA: hypothetical protein VFW96_09580 [Thermomicrobiales bacterium]|nr:hypothetical protein [Thermomicrobiales bacterium]
MTAESGYEPERERVPEERPAPPAHEVEQDRVMEEHPTRPSYEASLARERNLAAAGTSPIRDVVHWGPVWTGVLGAFAIFALLEMLVTAFGWITLNGAANPVAAWWSAVIGWVAFFVGGWIASATSARRDTGNGLVNGFAVWALGTVLLLALVALGTGGALGAASGSGGLNTSGFSNIAQTVAIGVFIFLLIAVGAALVGSYLGRLTSLRSGQQPNAR